MATTIPAPFAGKVAIVTGASRGIGASVAKKLAQQGVSHLSITYTSRKDKAEATVQEIEKANTSIKTTIIQADLLEAGFADKVINATLKDLGVNHIDIVIQNAAVLSGHGPTKKEWDNCMYGNGWVQYELAEAAINVMPKGGRVVLVSSAASKAPLGTGQLSYIASKAALDAISRNLAKEYGAPKGITVNSISVGTTETDALTANAGDAMGGLDREAFIKYAEGLSTLNRTGKPDEVADIIVFVASPAAGWLNGNQIPANGGQIATLQS